MPMQLAPVHLRPIGAAAHARHRLARPYRALCPLADGDRAELIVREHACPANARARGLALATRFGTVIAYDYDALLLACTGIEVGMNLDAAPSSERTAQVALARYGFAAMDPALLAAFGEPAVSDTPALAPEQAFGGQPPLALHVLIALSSIRLTMRLDMAASSVHALLDSEPWQPLPTHERASLPAWLASTQAHIRLELGGCTLPLAQCDGLARGDVVRVSTCFFDVAGYGSVRVGPHRLLLRWLDTLRCFEVQDMTLPPAPNVADRAGDGLPSTREAHDAREAHGAHEAHERPPFAPPGGSKVIDTGSIPVSLGFSLGILRLTVSEVAALAPGSLVSLTQGLPPEVVIEANGLSIGRGELVDLDGRLAVQITQWPNCASTTQAP